MAKFYVVYKKIKDNKAYVVDTIDYLKGPHSNKVESNIQITNIAESAKLFENLQDANEFLAWANSRKQSWFVEDIEVRVRRSRSTKPADPLAGVKEIINNPDNLVTGEDGNIYVNVKTLKGEK